MPTDPHEASRARIDANASRRWMVGIIITIVFGAFGVVMAILSYARRNDSAPASSSSPARQQPRESEPRDSDHDKGNKGKRDR